MTRFAPVAFLTLLASFAIAQIGDAEAVARARPIVARFASEDATSPPQLFRETMETAWGRTEIVHVNFGDFVVWLEGSGDLKGFGGPSRGPFENRGGEPDRYPTDEGAWRALETVLADLHLGDGLTRKELERDGRGGAPLTMRFTMQPRPYGYETDGGNTVRAEIHRITGQVISLSIARGWTYEAPNVRVSPEQAIETTRLSHGGEAAEWRVRLKYSGTADPNAPAYTRQLRSNKVMRLYYSVWSSRGSALVDSITGDIVEFISPQQVGSANGLKGDTATTKSTTSTDNKVVPSRPQAKVEPSAEKGGTSGSMWVAMGAVVLLAIVTVGAFFLRTLRLRK